MLPMIELVEPVVRLETSEQGEANWKLQPTQTVADKSRARCTARYRAAEPP